MVFTATSYVIEPDAKYCYLSKRKLRSKSAIPFEIKFGKICFIYQSAYLGHRESIFARA